MPLTLRVAIMTLFGGFVNKTNGLASSPSPFLESRFLNLLVLYFLHPQAGNSQPLCPYSIFPSQHYTPPPNPCLYPSASHPPPRFPRPTSRRTLEEVPFFTHLPSRASPRLDLQRKSLPKCQHTESHRSRYLLRPNLRPARTRLLTSTTVSPGTNTPRILLVRSRLSTSPGASRPTKTKIVVA